jgi:hypothetical protein
VRVRGLVFCRQLSPCLGPSLKDVRNYDTPIRKQQAAVTVRYMHADQQAAVSVEPLRLTCASSGDDSAAAAAAAAADVAVSSASFVASRESVLFIGTQFSILYTSMYSPAKAATPRA